MIVPEMIKIPKCHFIMGSLTELDHQAFGEEQPMHIVYLTDFALSRTPITNKQYADFVAATRHRSPEGWQGSQPPRGKKDHPVVNVNWFDANAFCQWLAEQTGILYRLPSEAEWEKAARGVHANLYPWGNQWEDEKCNTVESGLHDTVEVGHFQHDRSPYEILDLAGNVFEWTNTLWAIEDTSGKRRRFPYPYNPNDGREGSDANSNMKTLYVARGGSYLRPQRYSRCASRIEYSATIRMTDLGFRIATDIINA